MGFFSDILNGIAPGAAIERKGDNFTTRTIALRSEGEIEDQLRELSEGDRRFTVSAVHACARVIAEGLALPPCYVHKAGAGGKTLATSHPLFALLNASPNARQTSYEFREQLGYHLALNSNAYVYVTRSATGAVLELMPCDPGMVEVWCDTSKLGNPVQYYLFGQPVPRANIWHLKGPAWLSWTGMSTVQEARKAIGLAAATETFGAKLFTNGAKPGGIISPNGQAPLTPAQMLELKELWQAQAQGVGNAHKTMFLNAPVDFKSMASTANEAQFIEARRFQLEEICRYFRVSPTKVMQQLGSQSYASVEQAHISHDQDTDAHWHERFVQSANKALLSDKERRQGFAIAIDNRAALRGTAVERMTYYNSGIASGIFTRNEAREMEGFDRSTDPEADKLTPAANLFGPKTASDTPPAK